jgi:regulatory protein YycI of two-component signal transduction system YycFG
MRNSNSISEFEFKGIQGDLHMDWSKSKIVLIILFVALNVYLGFNVIKYYQSDNISGETITEVQKLLDNNGVAVNCDIPVETKCYRLNYTIAEFDQIKVIKTLLGETNISSKDIQEGKGLVKGSKSLEFENQNIIKYSNKDPHEFVDTSNYDEVITYCKYFLTLIGVSSSEYVVEDYGENKDSSITLLLTEKYKGYLVYNNFAEIKISKKGIISLKCGKVGIIGLEKNKIDIVPAYKILIKNYVGSKNTVIKNIDLGFHCIYPSEGTNYQAVPEWRIKSKDGIRYFTAVG